jgi:peptidoglycan biosynthesis protein MviN/MurJ (putative lipid II flippase)
MWLILTALAAIAATIVWYVNAPSDKYKLGFLSLLFWGATIMWLVDHLMAYLTEGGEFFEFNLDATLLGITVIILALTVWLITLLANDPNKIFQTIFKR